MAQTVQKMAERLAKDYQAIGLDLNAPAEFPQDAKFIEIDLSSDKSVRQALQRVKRQCISPIASVVHLAAYFDLTGEENMKYEEITLRGTERLLAGLQDSKVEQFIFASSMLAHAPCKPGETIDESWPLKPRTPYDVSKVETEQIVREKRGDIPVVLLRPAGVYDNRRRNAFLAQQIARIHEERLIAHFYPRDLRTGQSFLPIEDLLSAIQHAIKKRAKLPEQLLASCGIGIALMFPRLIFGTEGDMADSDHLVGSLVIVVAVTAFAEVARPVRFINIVFGLWLMAAPWIPDRASMLAAWANVAAGLALIALPLPLGERSKEHYGSWDRYVL